MRRARRYVVTYEFDGQWWGAAVRGVPGCHTQGRSLRQARHRIRDALSNYIGESAAESAVLVDDVRLSAEDQKSVDTFIRADVDERKAREARAKAARALASKYSRRDAGALLGLSHQRIQQIVSESPTRAKSATRR